MAMLPVLCNLALVCGTDQQKVQLCFQLFPWLVLDRSFQR